MVHHVGSKIKLLFMTPVSPIPEHPFCRIVLGKEATKASLLHQAEPSQEWRHTHVREGQQSPLQTGQWALAFSPEFCRRT